MAAFFNAVSAVVVLLLLMLVGYFMGAAGWMTAGEKRFLGKYIINIAVPCNCLVGLLNNLDRDMLAQAGWMLLGAVLGVSLTLLLGMALAAYLTSMGAYTSLSPLNLLIYMLTWLAPVWFLSGWVHRF